MTDLTYYDQAPVRPPGGCRRARCWRFGREEAPTALLGPALWLGRPWRLRGAVLDRHGPGPDENEQDRPVDIQAGEALTTATVPPAMGSEGSGLRGPNS